MKLAAAALGLAAAGSCHGAPTYVFHCPDGASVAVRYANDSVSVRLPEGSAVLPRALSGSGARYANDTLEVWEHAGEVRVSRRGQIVHEHCRVSG